jgi:predicted homoserine dehydrogenase-like protein
MIFSPYDVALQIRESEHRPIRIGLVGAGNLARMVALQLLDPPPPGLRLVAIANRTVARAAELLLAFDVPAREVTTSCGMADAIRGGHIAYTGDAPLLANCEEVDVVLETTGTVEFALQVTLAAFAAKKPVVLANAELDSTLGPILRVRAQRAGVVVTNIDGDEPGVAMNLVRYARSVGMRPVAAGNLKGMIDPYRNPDTQAAFAHEHGQNPKIVTSFADGTKLSMEAAILANATGFRVGRPGMHGPRCKHVREIAGLLPSDQMLGQGLVDYALGAEPFSGAFVVVWEPNPNRQRWLRYLKMGDGPFFVLYTPYHLPHIQAIATIARAVVANDPTVTPCGAPVCQVVCRAKTDLAAGLSLDGPGGFFCYGQIENLPPADDVELGLPIALSTGCTLRRPIARDERIAEGDVVWPGESASRSLWLEMLTQMPRDCSGGTS